MTDQTPSQKPALRDQLINALGRIDTIPPIAHRRAQADNVLAVLYREWPWLRAAAEDASPVPGSDREQRIRLDDLTSDALDALYEQIEAAEENESQRQLATAREALASATTRAARAEHELAALRQVARGYCPACGRGDAAPSVADWEQQRQRADQAEAALAQARSLHRESCPFARGNVGRTAFTCGMCDALDPPAPAATQAAEHEKTTRVFAALHHSAEQDVTRVIALYEQWIKAGPPPLGTPTSRWWDARLAELHDAILTAPAHDAGPTVAECAANDRRWPLEKAGE